MPTSSWLGAKSVGRCTGTRADPCTETPRLGRRYKLSICQVTLTDSGLSARLDDMSTDVQSILSSGSLRQLLALWDVSPDRRMWTRVLSEEVAKGDDQAAKIARTALEELGDASALDSLRANAEMVKLLTGWRWFVMQQAREEGATWEQVGEALGMTRQAAWDWYKRNIEQQETYVSRYHDTTRGRAALGQPGE